MLEGDNGSRVPLVMNPSSQDGSVYDGYIESGNVMPNLYRVLANTPGLLNAWVAFAWPLREIDSSPRAVRELAITYLAVRRSSEYVRVHHRRFARQYGVASELFLELDQWRQTDAFNEQQRAALQLVDDIVDEGAASAETMAECVRIFREDGAVQLVVTVGFYEAVCVINRSVAIPLET